MVFRRSMPASIPPFNCNNTSRGALLPVGAGHCAPMKTVNVWFVQAVLTRTDAYKPPTLCRFAGLELLSDRTSDETAIQSIGQPLGTRSGVGKVRSEHRNGWTRDGGLIHVLRQSVIQRRISQDVHSASGAHLPQPATHAQATRRESIGRFLCLRAPFRLMASTPAGLDPATIRSLSIGCRLLSFRFAPTLRSRHPTLTGPKSAGPCESQMKALSRCGW